MRLLIVRHAIAEERAGASGRDADRRLSHEGRQKFRLGARALAALVPDLELVLTSPYRRTLETARMLSEAHLAHPPVQELAQLAPDNAPADVVSALRQSRLRAVLAVVGHEPLLSQLEGFLLTGEERSLTELRKGGAALLELPSLPEPGQAVLLWHLTPAQLRELAG